jgi:uncharacterized Zn-binding protein involved in type VI secretion
MNKKPIRLGDSTSHGGIVSGSAAFSVWCEGKPLAISGAIHLCPACSPGPTPLPHVGGALIDISNNVFAEKRPVMTSSSKAFCLNSPPATVISHCYSVFL